ncbi:nadh-ubiquinone oxidoreductase 105 kda subunit [Paraphaeosphaeria sporulosa]
MASKYGFAKQLKELRFLFCQTSEHSAATRYAPAANSCERCETTTPTKTARPHCVQREQRLTDTRSFLTKSYPTMKKHNPYTPILIREASGTEPRLYARYEFGKEKSVPLKGLDDKAIEQKVTELVKASI